MILTTEPNDLIAQVHNRMPVVLDPTDYEQWLDPDVQEVLRLKPLLRSYQPEQMMYYPVSLRVNNPKNDDSMCIDHQQLRRVSNTAAPSLNLSRNSFRLRTGIA